MTHFHDNNFISPRSDGGTIDDEENYNLIKDKAIRLDECEQ